MATAPMAKMEQLDKVEKEIVSCLQTGGQALAEVARDKPSQKQVDLLVTQFMTCLGNIDSSLTDHIRYLSQVSRAGCLVRAYALSFAIFIKPCQSYDG